MATKKGLNTAEVVFIVAQYLGDEAADRLSAIFEDPGADHDFAQLARLGKILSDTGKHLSDGVRKSCRNHLSGGTWAQDGVVLEFKPAHKQERINGDMVRDLYPIEERPDLYNIVPIKESVAVKVKALSDIPVQHESPDDVDFFREEQTNDIPI